MGTKKIVEVALYADCLLIFTVETGETYYVAQNTDSDSDPVVMRCSAIGGEDKVLYRESEEGDTE